MPVPTCLTLDLRLRRRPRPARGPCAARVRELFALPDRAAPAVPGRCRLACRPGEITLVVGPSGAGKSTLLAAAVRRLEALRRPVFRADRWPLDGPFSAIDRTGLPLPAALSLLAAVGLAEARSMVARPEDLSDGQRQRLRLALALSAAWRVPGAVVVMDEFAATLDRLTAQVLARSVRRLTDRLGLTVLLATAHDDLFEALDPDVVVLKPLAAGVVSIRRTRRPPASHPGTDHVPAPVSHPPRRHAG